ncbi:hypothetical protein C8R47DRAFT_1088673 [Mycena vitilis]|nr:hypothetical protein C8R47DRAFT_1088673 [Mycena vitilis]
MCDTSLPQHVVGRGLPPYRLVPDTAAFVQYVRISPLPSSLSSPTPPSVLHLSAMDSALGPVPSPMARPVASPSWCRWLSDAWFVELRISSPTSVDPPKSCPVGFGLSSTLHACLDGVSRPVSDLGPCLDLTLGPALVHSFQSALSSTPSNSLQHPSSLPLCSWACPTLGSFGRTSPSFGHHRITCSCIVTCFRQSPITHHWYRRCDTWADNP